MRILILSDRIPPENAGGAEKVAWQLACSLRDAGHEAHVAAATPGAPFEAVREGIATYHLHARYRRRFQAYLGLYNPQTAAPLRALYQRLRPDIVNAHNIHAYLSYHSLTLAHGLGIPAVFSSHDVMPFAYNKATYFIHPETCAVQSYRLPPLYNLRQMRLRYNPFRNWVIRHILSRHTVARTCVSQAHRLILEANDLPPFQVVHNGIAAEAWQVAPQSVAQVRTRLGLAGRKVLLFAGRLTREKGSQQILAALKALVERMPEALLLVLARGELDGLESPEYRSLKETFVRAGGWLAGDELKAAYAAVNAVVVPSICLDCFPTVNLEAMAAGKPVVATCYGGSAEAVINGETGYIVNPFDTPALVEHLETLLRDDDLQRRMGEAGKKRTLEHFTLKRQTDLMVQLYQDAQHQ